MITFNNLKNPVSIREISTDFTLPYNDKPMTISELSVYLNTKYPTDTAIKKFNSFVTSKLKPSSSHLVFTVCDEGQIMCLKVMSYAEAMLLADIINNRGGKMEEMKDMLYLSEFTNEDSFSDAIHQLFIKQTFLRANYVMEFSEEESKLDDVYFG